MDHTLQPQNTNLTEITTPIQASRGNRQFFCQKHKVSYISYANGYVRREIKAIYTAQNGKQYKCQDQFVLNRRKSIPNQWGFSTRVVIKEHCPIARMDMIDRISANYKGYTGRFTQFGHFLVAK